MTEQEGLTHSFEVSGLLLDCFQDRRVFAIAVYAELRIKRRKRTISPLARRLSAVRDGVVFRGRWHLLNRI